MQKFSDKLTSFSSRMLSQCKQNADYMLLYTLPISGTEVCVHLYTVLLLHFNKWYILK